MLINRIKKIDGFFLMNFITLKIFINMTRGSNEEKRMRKEFREICEKRPDDIKFARGYPSPFVMSHIIRQRSGVVIPENELENLLEEAHLAEERAEEEAKAAYQAKVAADKERFAAFQAAKAAAIEARDAALKAAVPIHFTVSIASASRELTGNIRYSNRKFSLEWLDLGSGVIRGADETFSMYSDDLGIFSSLIEFTDILSIIFVKLSLDGENPIVQSWVITLPRIRHWQDVVVRRFVEVVSTEQHLTANLLFAVMIHGEFYEMQLNYDSEGCNIDEMDCEILPLYAKSDFEASDDTSDKMVGEIIFLDEPFSLFDSVKNIVFEN